MLAEVAAWTWEAAKAVKIKSIRSRTPGIFQRSPTPEKTVLPARQRAFMLLLPVIRKKYELSPHLDERFPEDFTPTGEVAPALASTACNG